MNHKNLLYLCNTSAADTSCPFWSLSWFLHFFCILRLEKIAEFLLLKPKPVNIEIDLGNLGQNWSLHKIKKSKLIKASIGMEARMKKKDIGHTLHSLKKWKQRNRTILLAYPSETKAGNCRFSWSSPSWGSPFSKWKKELWDLLLLVFFPGNTAHWGFSCTTKQSSKPSDLSWLRATPYGLQGHNSPSCSIHLGTIELLGVKLLNLSVKVFSVMGHH